MKLQRKLITGFLLCSILFTNSCATIMTNWQEGKNTIESNEIVKRSLIKTDFKPIVYSDNKSLKISLNKQDFFEITQNEIHQTKKDNLWGYTFLPFLDMLIPTPDKYGDLKPTIMPLFDGGTGGELKIAGIVFLIADGLIVIGDLIWSNALSQPVKEIKEIKSEETKEGFLANTKVTLTIDGKMYAGESNYKGIVEFNNLSFDHEKPVRNASIALMTDDGRELTANLSPDNFKSFITVTDSPKITIIEPRQNDRGVSIVPNGKNILVKGKVEAKKGIFKLMINDYEINLNNENEFSENVALKGNNNEISIIAIDNKKNQTEKKIVISREAQLVNKPAVNKPSENPVKLNWYKKQYALVIGINNYKNNQIEPLKNAVNDAKSIATIFKKMGFQVKELYNSNATKAGIISAFREITRKAEKDDSFIFYFAGHGQGLSLETMKREGFIIPYDNSFDLSSGSFLDYDQEAISINAIKNYSGNMKAKHVGLLIDSCFSGLALRRSIAKMEGNYDLKYYNNLLLRKSINILTAGDDQPVSDGSGHSPFAQAVIRGLESNSLITENKDGFVLFRDLSVYVKNKVERATEGRQRPQFDNLSEDDGDFIFKIK